MPFLKSRPKAPSLVEAWDAMTQKNGLLKKVFSVNGDSYAGEWQDNQRHGRGTQHWKEKAAIYNGQWKFGKRDGYGTYSKLCPKTKQYSTLYSGQWKNGKKHGCGRYFYGASAVYEGEWCDGQRSGYGRLYYPNGDIYEGAWLHDKQHGLGMLCLVNGDRYEGSWHGGRKHGHGFFVFSQRGQLYHGFWVEGVCKCGTFSEGASLPAKTPIPKLELLDPQLVLMEAESTFKK